MNSSLKISKILLCFFILNGILFFSPIIIFASGDDVSPSRQDRFFIDWVKRHEPWYNPNGISFGVNYGIDVDEIEQWMQIDIDNERRFQLNNHFRYDGYYYMQQFNIHDFMILSDNEAWCANFGTTDNYEGTENSDDEYAEIYGIEYEDHIEHCFYAKAYGMDLIHNQTKENQGTINVRLDFNISTYLDRTNLKIGVTIYFPENGFPLDEGTIFQLKMRFDNCMADRNAGTNIAPDEIATYTATYNLPNGETASTYELNRNYIANIDGEISHGVADPQLTGPHFEFKSEMRGIYQFENLQSQKTIYVSLDPTLCTFGKYGEEASSIPGFNPGGTFIFTVLGIFWIIKKKKNERRKKNTN